MRPVSAIYAVQAGLQAADRGDTGIWRTPCSEKGPSGGTFELAHVLEIIGSICRVQAGLQAADAHRCRQHHSHIYLRRFLYGNNKVGCQQDAQNR